MPIMQNTLKKQMSFIECVIYWEGPLHCITVGYLGGADGGRLSEAAAEPQGFPTQAVHQQEPVRATSLPGYSHIMMEFVGDVHGILAQCFCSQTVSFINCYWYSEFDLPCLQCPSLPPSFFLCRSELEYEKRKGMLQELSDKYISCCLFVGKHTLLFCMWSCLCCVQVQTIGDG